MSITSFKEVNTKSSKEIPERFLVGGAKKVVYISLMEKRRLCILLM
ncbi:MAG: hypothetical protein LKM44_02015 [Wolbachia endosymbiont of Meromenopon meropis]|nr:hypothetical protein [Wolbachia endosymbiont of Meromenopon meropis]